MSNLETDGRKGMGASATTVALCCLVAVFEGFDLQAAGVAAPKLGPAFHMTPAQLGWFFSASTFGLMIGAAIGGRLSDRLGRKPVLIGSIAVFGLLSILNGLAPNIDYLLASRFLTGVGLGGALPNLLALVSENTGSSKRNTALGALYGSMPTGGALVSLISLLGATGNWRIVFFAGGVGPVLLIPLLILMLPRIAKREAASPAHADARKSGVIHALLAEGRAVQTLSLWAAFFLALLTFYILQNWLPTLLVGRGLARPNASLVQLAFNVCGAMGGVLIGVFMDRAPLSRVVPCAFLMGAIGLVLLWLAPVSLGVSLVVGGIVGASISTTQALLYALAPAVYPTEVRGTGAGAAVAAGRFGSASGPLLAGALLSAGVAPQIVLMVLVPTIVAAGLCAFVLALRMRSAGPAVSDIV